MSRSLGMLSTLMINSYINATLFPFGRLNVAVLARSRASQARQFSRGLPERKVSQRDDKCCTRKFALQRPAYRARFEPTPSCACRSDTSAAQRGKIKYSSPLTRADDRCGQNFRSVRWATLGQNFVTSLKAAGNNLTRRWFVIRVTCSQNALVRGPARHPPHSPE